MKLNARTGRQRSRAERRTNQLEAVTVASPVVSQATAPGCVTCDINNFDPTTYDLLGRYFYARASLKM